MVAMNSIMMKYDDCDDAMSSIMINIMRHNNVENQNAGTGRPSRAENNEKERKPRENSGSIKKFFILKVIVTMPMDN